MKKTILTLGLLFMYSMVSAAIEFVGYCSSGNTKMFALVDTTDGRTGWVAQGADFRGFAVAGFAHEKETLTLKRENETLQLTLRAASFTIPVEVIGAEREAQFFKKMKEMQSSIGPGKKFYPIEDYIATAAQFGREISSWETQNGVEVITMELPERLKPAAQGGVTQVRTISLSMNRRDRSRVKLIIH
jgi:hypothetical protein